MIWRTDPTVADAVPLPKLPAYLASRLAISPERSEEVERLLYKNAPGQIDDKFQLRPRQHAPRAKRPCRRRAPRRIEKAPNAIETDAGDRRSQGSDSDPPDRACVRFVVIVPLPTVGGVRG